ncbi:Hypothetical predicted protein [Paramuricea clavata]|uniref:Uncharacterized protein n=1 Tax=Paramuricea clavata TaxID=317549 RepID=A0A7D9ICL9_PARCT|nr:Hypothetical predicted protein [Paramuricea clavata]
MSIQMNENKGSYTDYLYKKEAKGKWVPYWVILDGKFLKFYETNKSENLIGSVEIGSKSKCVVSKRKAYSFPFILCAAHGRHLFKCESAARRHRWMTAIHQAAELLRFSTSHENNFTISDFENKELENIIDNSENDEDILPSNVLLVASLPTACDSPSLPFKLRNRVREFSDESTECQDGKTSPKHKSIVYPFDRNSEQSFQRISDLEREQFSSLNIHSSFESDSLSPRVRSFPTTPEKGARPISPALSLTSGSPYFGKSRSLNSLTSSRTDMRFSRHMVSGSDCGDMEV